MNKTLTRKLFYVVVALCTLAMLIPAMAIPAGAAPPSIKMVLVDPITLVPQTTVDSGYNILGSRVQVSVELPDGAQVMSWAVINIATAPGRDQADFVVPPAAGATTVQVYGIEGDAEIVCYYGANGVVTGNLSVEKKWGQITNTEWVTKSGSSAVTWDEAHKVWVGGTTVTDKVNGAVYQKGGFANNVLQGAILNWYLVRGDAVVPMAARDADLVNADMAKLATPSHVTIKNGATPFTAITVTGLLGTSSIELAATGEEAVKVVVVPQYPFTQLNDPVTPEVFTWNFYTTEMEVVPQVRWAGEKIVLEKCFGTTYIGRWVKFSLQNQSVGALEGISGNATVNGSVVWTQIDSKGFASAILVSSDQGVANVVAGLYDHIEGSLLDNQHFFTVYFLKLESLNLRDVKGKRVGDWYAHDSGWWTTANPWDRYNADNVKADRLNVSQDALLRANVRGWFTSNNPSWRPERYVDPMNAEELNDKAANTIGTLSLPKGRWILPDDWEYLAGPNWEVSRMHWDINCNPDGSVKAKDALGPYSKGGVNISAYPNVGPFSPGLEVMLPDGWQLVNSANDPARKYDLKNPATAVDIATVVPDTVLNAWDAPMPPAKIIFQIQKTGNPLFDQAGYFKSAMKTDIYYLGAVKVDSYGKASVPDIVYTNPFYKALIPAHQAIPVFINNGGYDWDSFDTSYGAYTFWTIINQNAYKPLVNSSDPSGHPTVAEVYSDNHGEAMIWLNGNWNFTRVDWVSEGKGVDIPFNTDIATTTIQATADYPYSRLHQAFQSNKDTKTWWWGGQILGADTHLFPNNISTNTNDTRMVLSIGTYDVPGMVGVYPNQAAKSASKMVWLWITDRDGYRKGVRDAYVVWELTAGMAQIATTNGMISQYNEITQNITLENGFLSGTNGSVSDDYRLRGKSYFKEPTSYEVQLFNKFWGAAPAPNPVNPQNPTANGGTSNIRADASRYLVAAVKVESLNELNGQVAVNEKIFTHDFDLEFGQATPNYVRYKTNLSFTVADALDDGIRDGDANCDGVVNMGDVTAVERMILGYAGVTSNSIVNNDGTVDMGTVVKIERTILGLP